MEKQTVYVLQRVYYDYYEFSDLLLASTKLSEILDYLVLNNKSKDVFNWWELSDEKKHKIHVREIEHYRITKF